MFKLQTLFLETPKSDVPPNPLIIADTKAKMKDYDVIILG